MFIKKLILITGCLLLAVFANVFADANQPEYLYVKAAPSGPWVYTTSTDFVDIPDLSLSFFQYQPGWVSISISAECYATNNARMFVRAVVDGLPASPSDVILVVGDWRGTSSFNFTAVVDGGLHTVTMQYKVDSGGEANLADRTMWVSTAPFLISTVAAASGPDISTTSGSFVDIEDLATSIDLYENGDITITLTSEAETTGGKRMFVRAVIDGQAASPSDVVFCNSSFTGTHSFTFTVQNVTLGTHDVRVQWKVDGEGTAYLGDRTMTVASITPTLSTAAHGVIASVSAPSGATQENTSASWSDIPDLSTTVNTPGNSQVVVSLTAETFTSTGERLFVRALLDGQAASPSDAVFMIGDLIGTQGIHFTFKNIAAGSHQVSLQWSMDGTGTGYLADRNMTVMAFTAPCPDLNSAFTYIEPESSNRNLLVICWDPHRPEHPAPPIIDINKLIFGNAAPSVRDYFIVNSNDRLFIDNPGILGWYDADKSADHYWAADDLGDSNGDGWIHGHVEKWAEAICKADPFFDFASYDSDGDGKLTPDELSILMVIPQNSPFGTNRTPVAKEYPSAEPLIVDGVEITLIAEAYIGAPLNLPVVTHELSHALLDQPDMYFSFFLPYAAGAYSLMDISYADAHLDPFSKIRMGWIQPAIVHQTCTVPIDAVELSHVAYVLYDPAHGSQEYFIVENRQPNLAYDTNLPDAGLAVWQIMEDPDVYGNLPSPTGVNAADWATIDPGDWGRRAIRMIRPVYGPPFDNRLALWDGSDPQTGYNLLSDDPDPAHATLKWYDGTPSGFAVKNISASGTNMTALIEIPGMPSGVNPHESTAAQTPARFFLAQNFPNPFNASTTIGYTVTKPVRVLLKIFNLGGQEVTTLVDRHEESGEKIVQWDGKNNAGETVGSGVYIYRMQAGGQVQSLKLVMMK